MPFVQAGDLRMHYELERPAGAPVVVLSHSLGADLSMWDPQRAGPRGAVPRAALRHPRPRRGPR